MPELNPWITIGHFTNPEARTGCTVILFDQLVAAAVDVRGGAPGTRETSLLDSGRLVGRADAILLSGGSAFGLAAADGVMRYLVEQGRGLPTAAIPVPIVPAAVVFDLTNGESIWPTADDGYSAVSSSVPIENVRFGRVGAGTGATVAKLGGDAKPGGLGIATATVGGASVTAIVVVNAVGDIVDPTTGVSLAAATDPEDRGRFGRELAIDAVAELRVGENTTIGAILIDGVADRATLQRCCIAGHDAFARCIVPAHTIFDGDTLFAAARHSGDVSPRQMLALTSATEQAVEQAIVSIFRDDRSGSE